MSIFFADLHVLLDIKPHLLSLPSANVSDGLAMHHQGRCDARLSESEHIDT